MVNTSVAYKLSMLVNQVQLIKYCIPPRSECDYGMQSHQFMPKKPLHEPYNLSINSFIEVHNHVYNWIFVRTGILISCVLLHPTVAAAPKILNLMMMHASENIHSVFFSLVYSISFAPSGSARDAAVLPFVHPSR